MKTTLLFRTTLVVSLSIVGLTLQLAPLSAASGGDEFIQDNLVSDIPGLASHTDPNLVNPWGITSSPTSPFWVSDNKTGVATLYDGTGQAVPQNNPLVVTIPPPGGGMPPSAPTGAIFNGTNDFAVAPGQPARFIFATEDGTIAGWNNGTQATVKVDNSSSSAVYKGIAMGTADMGSVLYATNFHSGKIDMFNASFGAISIPGAFTDPSIPQGFAPFNIQNIGGNLFVTYAKQDAALHDDVAGPGNGFVDVYNPNGRLLQHLIANGPLNSPWGLTLASSHSGLFSNDLLVGNFGDGTINAFDPATGQFLGQLKDRNGQSLVIEGLWGLRFGNGATGADPNSLFFTAGIPGGGAIEDHGLFGRLTAVPEPSSILLLSSMLLPLVLRRSLKK